jgi:hypothetical protein
MDNAIEVLKGLSYSELQEVSKMLVDLKRQAKADSKDAVEKEREEVVASVNELIESNSLVKGSTILLSYKGQAVSAEVVTVPTVSSRNLKVSSDSFKTKDKTRYAEKHTFLELVD